MGAGVPALLVCGAAELPVVKESSEKRDMIGVRARMHLFHLQPSAMRNQ